MAASPVSTSPVANQPQQPQVVAQQEPKKTSGLLNGVKFVAKAAATGVVLAVALGALAQVGNPLEAPAASIQSGRGVFSQLNMPESYTWVATLPEHSTEVATIEHQPQTPIGEELPTETQGSVLGGIVNSIISAIGGIFG